MAFKGHVLLLTTSNIDGSTGYSDTATCKTNGLELPRRGVSCRATMKEERDLASETLGADKVTGDKVKKGISKASLMTTDERKSWKKEVLHSSTIISQQPEGQMI